MTQSVDKEILRAIASLPLPNPPPPPSSLASLSSDLSISSPLPSQAEMNLVRTLKMDITSAVHFAKLVLSYRKYSKILSTYVRPLPHFSREVNIPFDIFSETSLAIQDRKISVVRPCWLHTGTGSSHSPSELRTFPNFEFLQRRGDWRVKTQICKIFQNVNMTATASLLFALFFLSLLSIHSFLLLLLSLALPRSLSPSRLLPLGVSSSFFAISAKLK
jgi:hypothetical protein